MSLRARLTVGYSAVLGVVLLLFGSAVYLLLASSLTRQVDETLQRTSADILRFSRRDVRGIVLPPLELTANVFVEVWDSQGVLAVKSPNLPDLNDPFDAAALANGERALTEGIVEGVHLRILTVPIVIEGGEIAGHLQLATSLEVVDAAEELLLAMLGAGGVGALLLAAAIGWGTAWAALRPLESVTRSASTISRTDDLARRIPRSGPPGDEVGRLVDAFNQTLQRLEDLFETQRRFLADVSHELRTPLTAIRANVDLLRRLGGVDAEALDSVAGEVDRMTRLVRDLLLLAQAESGHLPLGREPVELDTLLLEVYQQAKVLAQERVEVRLGGEDRVTVPGDRDRLKQVLLNLVANALDHTPEAGTVTLSLAGVGEFARITVSDTGPGIPREELPRIFERFYRIDQSRKRKAGGGAGLGLSIAYWIVRNHQGRIEVASEAGRGATFSVWLPQNRGNGLGARGEGRVPASPSVKDR
ncbi:MAG: ATP-binding protein [Anaerolineales bacterium]